MSKSILSPFITFNHSFTFSTEQGKVNSNVWADCQDIGMLSCFYVVAKVFWVVTRVLSCSELYLFSALIFWMVARVVLTKCYSVVRKFSLLLCSCNNVLDGLPECCGVKPHLFI